MLTARILRRSFALSRCNCLLLELAYYDLADLEFSCKLDGRLFILTSIYVDFWILGFTFCEKVTVLLRAFVFRCLTLPYSRIGRSKKIKKSKKSNLLS
ncbi:hypothetical protein Leryth_018268 [Lithospermum erythrorhizon]|nr:hypothetical protein Leryth_018268 [Lithospermum erythrorhizon]